MPEASALLELERVSETSFRAVHNQNNYLGSIFGGQPLCQALAAAQQTVADWPVHSSASQFLRAGAPDLPVDYEVERARDGRRYASRRVLASQAGRPIFDTLCSFHDLEQGFQHQTDTAPPAPDPDGLLSLQEAARVHASRLNPKTAELYSKPFPVELRLFDPELDLLGPMTSPRRSAWMRMPSAAAIASPRDHACLLAFMSDYWLAGVVGGPHAKPARERRVSIATLNHSIWFHAPVRADQWLLYQTESPWAADGRGLARGAIYDRSGMLAASTMQEVSLRPLGVGRADPI